MENGVGGGKPPEKERDYSDAGRFDLGQTANNFGRLGNLVEPCEEARALLKACGTIESMVAFFPISELRR